MVPAGPGQKPKHLPPSSMKLPLIDGWRAAALKLLLSGSPQIRGRGMEWGEFSFWTSDANVKIKKKSEFEPFRSTRPGFFPFFFCHFWPKRQWPYHGLTDRFFLFFYPFFDLGRQWPYHEPGMWDRDMVIDVPVWNIFLKKTGLTDRGMATDVSVQNDLEKKKEKTRSVGPLCGHWRTGSKAWLKKSDRVCQTVILLLVG